MTSLLVILATDDVVELDAHDVATLVDAFGALSGTSSASATMGRIRHALDNTGEVVLDETDDAEVLLAVLDRADDLSPMLEELQILVLDAVGA